MASKGLNVVAGDVEGNKNCTVISETPFTRFVSKLFMNHT